MTAYDKRIKICQAVELAQKDITTVINEAATARSLLYSNLYLFPDQRNLECLIDDLEEASKSIKKLLKTIRIRATLDRRIASYRGKKEICQNCKTEKMYAMPCIICRDT